MTRTPGSLEAKYKEERAKTFAQYYTCFIVQAPRKDYEVSAVAISPLTTFGCAMGFDTEQGKAVYYYSKILQ